MVTVLFRIDQDQCIFLHTVYPAYVLPIWPPVLDIDIDIDLNHDLVLDPVLVDLVTDLTTIFNFNLNHDQW